jgi:DNA-binding LacI/PurR family transcriptional regulator
MEIRLEDDRVTRLQQVGLPFVTIGRTRDAEHMWWVDIDYTTLVSRCVHHLADLGHRNIALVNRSTELVAAGYGPGHRALTGFTDALHERNVIGVDVCCADDAPAGEACVEYLREHHPRVTALVTVNEAALPGIQRGLERAGLRVPRDFSVAGVAARHWAEDFRPPMTAVDIPTENIGAQAVELLLERLAAVQVHPRQILHAPPVSLRATTGPAPRSPR